MTLRRYCLTSGCNTLVSARDRCPEHDTARRGSSAQRGYGRGWNAKRNRHLAKEPLCRRCDRRNRVTAGDLVDHVVPHRNNPILRDEDWNLQTLCLSDHRSKTAGEEDGWAQLIYPLPAYGPINNLRVITGMPGSGKTTYVEQHRELNDTVLDLDALGGHLFRTGPYRWPKDQLAYVLAERNNRLDYAERNSTGNTTWLIVTAPQRAHRLFWVNLWGAHVTTLEADARTAIQRIEAATRDILNPAARPVERLNEWREAIARWVERYEADEGDRGVESLAAPLRETVPVPENRVRDSHIGAPPVFSGVS